jgi:hypothetical protein
MYIQKLQFLNHFLQELRELNLNIILNTFFLLLVGGTKSLVLRPPLAYCKNPRW